MRYIYTLWHEGSLAIFGHDFISVSMCVGAHLFITLYICVPIIIELALATGSEPNKSDTLQEQRDGGALNISCDF
jgi:hypothetical protein